MYRIIPRQLAGRPPSARSLAATAAAVVFCTACLGDPEVEPQCTGDGVSVVGIVREFTPGVERQQFPPIEGVEVCLHESDSEAPCAETDVEGAFALCDVPAGSEQLIRFEHPDHLPMLRMLVTRQEDYQLLAETVMGHVDLAKDQAAEFGVSIEAVTGGAVQFFAAAPGAGVLQVRLLADYSVELRTLEGDPAMCPDADGGEIVCQPLYLAADGEPDADLEAATRIGIGALANVPPGTYELHFSHPELLCNQALLESGYPAAGGDEAVRIEIRSEFITAQAGIYCEPGE